MSIIKSARVINYPDIADLERQVRYESKRIKFFELVNIPITVVGMWTGPSIFPKLDENGQPVLDKYGNVVMGKCAVLQVVLDGTDEVRSFSTGSSSIIKQIENVQNHFMVNNIPKEYQGFRAIVKRDGRKLRLFTSKNALMDPVLEHGNQSLEESGSPIDPKDIPEMDEETIEQITKADNEMTQLVGNPCDPYNNTTLPTKLRKKIRLKEHNDDHPSDRSRSTAILAVS